MPRGQDYNFYPFTLAAAGSAGDTIVRPIAAGDAKYVLLYQITTGGQIAISEYDGDNDYGFTPLPYGITAGFTTARGLSFKNLSAIAINVVVLYGRGPIADNRFVQDPGSFGQPGSGALSVTGAPAGNVIYIPPAGPFTNTVSYPVSIAAAAGKKIMLPSVKVHLDMTAVPPETDLTIVERDQSGTNVRTLAFIRVVKPNPAAAYSTDIEVGPFYSSAVGNVLGIGWDTFCNGYHVGGQGTY